MMAVALPEHVVSVIIPQIFTENAYILGTRRQEVNVNVAV
jgi:hypothetical protein